MKIKFSHAREFLEGINENDRVAIFTHRDLDGMAAGILFSDFCKKRKAKVKTWILDYGTNRMSNYKLKMYNKILISDLAPNIVFQDLVSLGNKKVFYTDHHPEENESPIPDYVLELRTTSEGYFPSTRTVYELTEQENKDKLWLATLGTLSDMAEKYPENKEFLENAYKQLGLTQKDMMKYLFKFNFALIGSSSMEKSFKEISKLSRLGDIAKLAKYYEPVEREFQRVTEDYKVNRQQYNKTVYYYLETSYPGVKSAIINAVSGEEKEKVLVFATPKENSMISLSGRNQSKEYNVAKILKDCVKDLEGGSAGGHNFAAGGQVAKSDLEKFKDNLIKYNVEDARV